MQIDRTQFPVLLPGNILCKLFFECLKQTQTYISGSSFYPSYLQYEGLIIEVYKIVKGIDKVNSHNLLLRAWNSKTIGCRCNVRGTLWRTFSHGCERASNKLLKEVVEASSIAKFKRHLDRYIYRKGLLGHGPSNFSQHGVVGSKSLFLY